MKPIAPPARSTVRRTGALLALAPLFVGVYAGALVASATTRAPGGGSHNLPPLAFFGRARPVEGLDAFGRRSWIARLPWSGSAVKARFRGSEIKVAIHSSRPGLHFVARIDNEPEIRFAVAEGLSVRVLKRGLSARAHDIVLYRDSEGAQGSAEFHGFDLGRRGRFEPLATQNLARMEFIGDSITCGYGNLGSNCGYSLETQSATATYAQFSAEALGAAPPMQVCVSGIGVTRNYGESLDVRGSKILQTYRLAEAPGSSDVREWVFPVDPAEHPQFVVINLGTNDAWSGELPSIFTQSYMEFVLFVRSKYPRAHIICALGPMSSIAAPAITEAVQAMRAQGDRRVSSFVFRPQDPVNGIGCDWHPSKKTHRMMADELVAEIRRIQAE